MAPRRGGSGGAGAEVTSSSLRPIENSLVHGHGNSLGSWIRRFSCFLRFTWRSGSATLETCTAMVGGDQPCQRFSNSCLIQLEQLQRMSRMDPVSVTL